MITMTAAEERITPGERTRTMTLPDGRTLAWEEYGKPTGAAVFLFHGTPGSRLWMADDDPLAHRLGLRLIAPDRPGYGRSTPQPHRTMSDWACDVSRLADHLGHRRFAVLGVSGGGPYAAVTAHELPGRVAAAALVASPCPVDAPGLMAGMSLGNRVGLGFLRHLPSLGRRFQRWNFRALARLVHEEPERYIDMLKARVCDADRALLGEPAMKATLIREQQEAMRPGHEGALHDGLLLAREWGFDLGNIKVPVHVWHGEQDRLAPVGMGRYLVSRIPGAQGQFFPGEGHLLTDDASHWEAMLRALAHALADVGRLGGGEREGVEGGGPAEGWIVCPGLHGPPSPCSWRHRSHRHTVS